MNEELEVIRAVLEHSDQIVVVCRKGGNNLTFSEAAEKVFGPPRFFALQEDDAERYGLFYPGTEDLIPTYDLPMTRALKGETIRKALIAVRRPGEPQYLVSLNAGPLKDTDGSYYGAVLVGSILDVQSASSKREESSGNYWAGLRHASGSGIRGGSTAFSNGHHHPGVLENAVLTSVEGEDKQEQT